MTGRPPPPPRRPPRPQSPTMTAGPPAPDLPPAERSGPIATVEDERSLPQTFFLGRYRVVDEIGVGGMASVHLARVDGPGGFQKWVAIKRIHPHLVEDDQFVDMFLDEARIAAGINHANVAQVFDLGKDDSTYWIAMEYLHGEPLREIMRRVEEKRVVIPPYIAARVCADAAEGLHAAHQLRGRNGQLLNLVHRDVTPHNLFVTYEGYTKVVDFGIAKVVDRLASTRAGTLKGKLAYMSPEQVRGQEVDRRTDIFALGVVLWELCTKRRLFRMDTDLDTLEKVQACIVPSPSTIVANFPQELEQVIMTALAQRREDRFQTARDFSRALQRFLMTQGAFVGPEEVGEYSASLFADRVKKRERYLEWAAEVTSTVDVDQLRAQSEEDASSSSSLGIPAPQPAAQGAPAPVAGARGQGLNQSYGGNSASAAVVTSAPPISQRPPAPATNLASTCLMDEDEEMPTMVAMGIERPSHPGGQGAQAQNMNMVDDDDDELNSTIALPDGVKAGQIRAQIDHLDRQRAQNPAMSPPGGSPAQGAGAAVAMAPIAGPGGSAPPGQVQSVVETKMSMPRPAAVEQWLAEHGDVQIHGPRSMAVLMAIALLSTLCVIGIGGLIAHKLMAERRQASGSTVVPVAGASEKRADKDGAKSGAGEASAKADADSSSRVAGANAAGRAGTKASRGEKKKATKDAPGYLSVTCKPACNQVVAGGRSLGPSPVFDAPLPPGQYRVTLKRTGGATKTVSVLVASGQKTIQRVTMK